MSNDRNTPCPCGSGIKYKKCCLGKDQRGLNANGPDDLYWHQQFKMRNALIAKILKYLFSTYGDHAIPEAWDEFQCFPEEEMPFDENSYEMPLFMPWLYYDWTPDFSESKITDSDWTRVPPAHSMLMRHQNKLSALEKQYIEVCLSSPFTFAEVIHSTPGKGFDLKDIFTGEEWAVVEKSASKIARRGDILFCKPVTVNNLTTLEACAPFIIPPIHKKPMLDLRKHIAMKFKKINKEALSDYSMELIDLYLQMRDLIMNPSMPKLCNTDGDEMILQKLIFEINNPREAFEALKDLDIVSTESEILSSAEMDQNGDIKKVEITWGKQDKKNKTLNTIVLGHLTIEGKSLHVELNSMERAALFRTLVEERPASGARYKTTLITSIEAMREDAQKNKPGDEKNMCQEDLLEKHPELKVHLNEMMMAHWKNWVDMKIPALGNKTPRQAAKTKNGREMLEALLTQFERNAVDKPQQGVTIEIFNDIRKQLGLWTD